MSRRRQERAFHEPTNPTSNASRSGGVDLRALTRKVCEAWHPSRRALGYLDRRHRTWLVTDRTGVSLFDREVGLGDRIATCRMFWLEDQVRAFYHTEHVGRETDGETLHRQLRASFRVDQPDRPTEPRAAKVQDEFSRRREELGPNFRPAQPSFTDATCSGKTMSIRSTSGVR